MAENINARGNGERIEGTFPIRETNGDTKMKNISPSALPHFHGLTTEDPDTLLFEFDVICRTYDYVEDEQKFKLFPSTLKDVAWHWFMGLPGNSITTWAQMQQAFNKKYRDYCRSKDTKEEIFRMTMGSDESLENYEERFQLSYKRTKCTLDPESLKLVMLRGILEDLLDTLHLLWNASHQGWRPQYNSPPALLPPPPTQPQPLPPAPPRQPQMPAQPNLNPKNRQSQQVLPDSQPPPTEVEEDKEESEPKAIPPFPGRLFGTTQPTPEETELLGELKQLCVKIPLLQAIKYVLIYNKLIKEKFFRHPGRCKRDAPTINVIGQLSDLMLGQVIRLKYLDPGSLVVDVHINGTLIPHTLIDLGATINVMTKDTMIKLNLQGSLRKTTTVL
eukprot:PITA_25274